MELVGPSSLPFRLGSAVLGASLTFHLVHGQSSCVSWHPKLIEIGS